MKTSRERTGTTPEGTTWRTRPWSPAVEAKWACAEHHKGTGPCWLGKWGQCVSPVAPEGAKVKPYSPATPKGKVKVADLPTCVGEGYQAVFETARRRLAGLELWPVPVPVPPPTLSKLGRALTDPDFTKLYKDFQAAVRAAAPVAERRAA